MKLSEFKFSVILLSNNSNEGIEKTLTSLINQTLHFNDNIEVIIIDDALSKTQKTCNEYIDKYPNNIQHVTATSPNICNDWLENVSGEYILFIKANDYLSEETFEKSLKFIENNPNITTLVLPAYYYKNGKLERYLNYEIKSSRVFDLYENPEQAQLLGLSTIIKREYADNLQFLNVYGEYNTFLNEITINHPQMGICKDGGLYIENIEEKILPTEDFIIDNDTYSKFIDENLNRIIEKSRAKFGEVAKFVQFELVNQLKWLSTIEASNDEIDLSELKNPVNQIDDDIILNNILIENDTKIFLFLMKYGEIPEELKDKLSLNTVFVDVYDIINNELNILASITNVSPRSLDLLVNGEKINTEIKEFPQYDRYSLGHKYASNYSIEAHIPLSTDRRYELGYESENKKLDIDFSRPCNFSRSVGYAKTRHFISILKNNSIHIKKKTTLNWIKEEAKALVNLVKTRNPSAYKAIPFRMLYMAGYPIFRNKRIWFYMDRPTESDDNGLHLFKYSVKQNEDIEKYFVLDSKSEDYAEIEKIGKIIPYKSIKHRFMGLYVENIISSHPDNEIVYPFWGGYPFFAGLPKSNNIFLQHGILKDNISDWLNKKNMNICFFLVSSKREYDSTFKFPYNYGKGVVQLRGLPRYDNLKNVEDKHEIIIMPSWRRYLTRKSNEYIEETEYFKRFNSLINNERLIEKAREYGYDIIFRPHPNVYNFINLFDENDYVKIDYEKTKFQTLFNNGSLLITDYSSVAFDFAYLYKPVIYYQYGEDYHFNLEESYFDYETMGMGEVCKDEDELVDIIIYYIENQCKIKDKYSKRIDDFFLFNDKNNCKRVHEAIKRLPLKD